MADDGMLEYRIRPWAELNPDTLGLIFQKVPLDVILNAVPLVCKAWSNVVKGPYSWVEIIYERYCLPEAQDRLLQMLLQRSGDSVRVIHIYGASDNTLSIIAPNGKNLDLLRLPQCDISNSIVKEVSPNFSNLTLLDLSYCINIGALTLEAIGKQCKLLTTLLRNMNQWDIMEQSLDDDEALEIAATMPNLKHLELAYSNVRTEGVVQLIDNLPELEFLDVRGCLNMNLKAGFIAKLSKLKLVGPMLPGISHETDVDDVDATDLAA